MFRGHLKAICFSVQYCHLEVLDQGLTPSGRSARTHSFHHGVICQIWSIGLEVTLRQRPNQRHAYKLVDSRYSWKNSRIFAFRVAGKAKMYLFPLLFFLSPGDILLFLGFWLLPTLTTIWICQELFWYFLYTFNNFPQNLTILEFSLHFGWTLKNQKKHLN